MAVAAVVTQIAHLVAAGGFENARSKKQRRLVKPDGACSGSCSEIEAGTVRFRVLSERREIPFVGERRRDWGGCRGELLRKERLSEEGASKRRLLP